MMPNRALLALLTLLAPLAASAAEWVHCAREGQTCRVSGEALVRFGVAGSYTFRHTSGDVECSAQGFGSDPAFGQTKQCEVSVNWRNDPGYHGWRRPGTVSDWRYCAPEGGVCQAATGAQVRFGIDGQYRTRRADGAVRCDVRTFGDPAPGASKVCEISGGGAWAHCANEGEYCQVPSPTVVRYGLGASSVERQVSGGVACNNSTFGDPAPGMAKQCEYRVLGGAPDGPTRSFGLNWQPCAREGGACDLGRGGLVRYGAVGRYTYREGAGRMGCNNDEFGVDPAPGQTKSCEALYGQR